MQICLHKSRGHREEDFHYLIMKNGDIKQYHEVTEPANNDKNHNKDVIAIGLEGDFTVEEMTQDQKDSLTILVYKLCMELKIDTSMHHIFCHCDYRDPPGDRYCPGKYLHRFVSELGRIVYEWKKKGVRYGGQDKATVGTK